MMKKISVLGAGSWGTALAMLLNENGHDVTIWSIDQREVKMLNEEREQKDKLPGIPLSEKIAVTNDLKEAVEGRDV